MSEHDAFYRAILAEPAADVHRLVYADWLDETTDPANAVLAEYIRLQCEADQRPRIDRHRYLLDQRMTAIFNQHWMTWWRPICQKLGLPKPKLEDRTLFGRARRSVRRDKPVGWPYYLTDIVGMNCILRHYDSAVPWSVRALGWARFVRGFVEELNLTGDSRAAGPSLTDWLAVVPAQTVCLTTRTAADFSAVDTPALRQIRALDLEITDANNVATYLWSPNFAALEDLKLNTPDEGISAGEIVAVATSPAAPRLRRLVLSLNDEAAAEEFARSRFPMVRELLIQLGDRDNNTTTLGGWNSLAEATIFPQVERLKIFATTDLPSSGFPRFCGRPWSRLMSFDLEVAITIDHVTALVEADGFPQLRELSIVFDPRSANECLTQLVRWPRLRQLTYLSIRSLFTRTDPQLLAKLADALNPDVLGTLKLSDVKDPAVEAVLAPRLGERLWLR